MKKLLFACLAFLIVAQTAYAQPAIQNFRLIDKTTATRAASVSAAGAVSVDGSAVTQPVSVAAFPNEGQQTMANSISVAISSNQSAIPVTQSGTWVSRTQDGAGTAITSTGGALDVNILSGASAGTEYTEGAVDASITGTAILWEDAGNVLIPVSSAKPLPVSIAAALAAGTNNIGDVDVATIAAGDNNIGNVDIVTVPADPFGVNADAASATGSISAKLRFIASTGIPITGTVTVGSHAVTNAGTFVTQENGALLTSAQLIDDVVHSGDAVLSKYAVIGGVLDDTSPVAVTENSAQSLRITALRAAHVNLRNVAGTEIGTSGTPIRTDPTGASSQPVNNSTASSLNAQVVGDVANAAADGGNPVKIGGVGRTTNPTAVTDGQRVNAMFDKLGKQVTVGALRALKGKQKTTITSSTSETTIVTAVASTFLDVYSIIISNTSSTVVDVTIKDATAGSTVTIITVPADDVRGFTLPVDSAIPQAATNNNWTATCSASVASVEITALYVQNL